MTKAQRIIRRLRRRRARVLVHKIRVPNYRIMPDLMPKEEDFEIAERLLASYSKVPQTIRPNDIWTRNLMYQSEFQELLNKQNPRLLAEYLCNMNRKSATLGTVQGKVEFERLTRNFLYRRYIARMTADKILLLSEAIGASHVENPEQGDWGITSKTPLDEIVLKIEERLGFSITPPNIDGGLFKVDVAGTNFGERDLNAIYTATLIAREIPSNFKKMLEIGAGSGRVAYWASKFGVDDYTIVDLPHTNVIQGFYLMKALGVDRVSLYGENLVNPIKILPDTSYIETLEGAHFDLILNQDSFPEIAEDVVGNYLRWIKANGEFFLSINHESKPSGVAGSSQNNVPELLKSSQLGFTLKRRDSYWLRRGYVTELYST